MGDALRTLARMRRLQEELARSALAEAWRAERAAEDALEAARQAPRAEAAGFPGGAEHPLAVSFAVWLPAAMQAIGARRHGLEDTVAARHDAAAEVAASKARVEAVDIVLRERAAQARKRALKKTQLVLDEFASGPSR